MTHSFLIALAIAVPLPSFTRASLRRLVSGGRGVASGATPVAAGGCAVGLRPRALVKFGIVVAGCSSPSHSAPVSFPVHDDPDMRPMQVAVSTRVSAGTKSMFHSGGRPSGSSAYASVSRSGGLAICQKAAANE